ncbi:MAG: hypothetical protein QM539_02640 [Alphaproteobacteria bacterium]|nr:hypothetical protein [Alphaproteobacteria bacterium]
MAQQHYQNIRTQGDGHQQQTFGKQNKSIDTKEINNFKNYHFKNCTYLCTITTLIKFYILMIQL